MAKLEHGEIRVETTPGFEGWHVTATLFVDPRKMVLTEEQERDVREWLRNCLQKTVDAQLKNLDAEPVRQLTEEDILNYPLGI